MIFDAVKRAVFLSICEGVKKLLRTLKSEQPAQSDTWLECASCASCQRKRPGHTEAGTGTDLGREQENLK